MVVVNVVAVVASLVRPFVVAVDSLDVDGGTSYHHRLSVAVVVVVAVEMVT